MIIPAIAFGLSACASALTLWLLLRYARTALPLDLPNERSLHVQPIPRIGGVAILLGLAAAAATGATPVTLALGLAAALSAVSFLDDIARLPTLLRLVAHVGSAMAVVWFLLAPIDVAGYILLVLAVIWLTNLYNFMDGADGVAGGMAVIGFGLALESMFKVPLRQP